MQIDEHINRLISGYVRKDSTEKELSELYEWLEASDENLRYFREMVKLSSTVRTFNDPDFDANRQNMLTRLNCRIDSQAAAPEKKITGKLRIWSGVAAAVVLLAGSFFWYRSMEEKPVAPAPQILSYFNPTSETTPVLLEDGTEVLLGPESRLDYHTGEFDGHTERIADIQGKAYFDVMRDTTRPFIVNSGELLVRVLGTRFIVESHPDSTCTKILLEEGSIRLQTPERNNLVRLSAGQEALYLKEEEDLDITAVEVVPYVLENYKRLSFRQITIDGLIAQLGKIYHTELYCDQPTDNTTYEINCYRSNTLEEVLDIIYALTGVRLQERTE